MKPVMSLSKTWKPRQYSSGSPGSRKPPGRFRILEKESKSTAEVEGKRISEMLLFVMVVGGGRVDWVLIRGCRGGRVERLNGMGGKGRGERF